MQIFCCDSENEGRTAYYYHNSQSEIERSLVVVLLAASIVPIAR